jgi:hypothetical protein
MFIVQATEGNALAYFESSSLTKKKKFYDKNFRRIPFAEAPIGQLRFEVIQIRETVTNVLGLGAKPIGMTTLSITTLSIIARSSLLSL